MKRPNTLGIFAMLALVPLIGIALISTNASADRTYGIEQGDIASIDAFALIDRALSTDAMSEERRAFEEDSNATIGAMQNQLVQLQNQLNNMSQDDPSGGQLFQQYQQLQSQLQQASQQASAQYQTLIAEQIANAYREIYAAANEMAAQEGYAFVFATRSDGELLQTDTITGITQEILARPLVTPPLATDLTEAIRVKLGYPEEVVESATEMTPDAEGVEPMSEQDAEAGGAEDAGDDNDPQDPMSDD